MYAWLALRILCLNPHTDVWEWLAKLWRYNCEWISVLTKPLYYEQAAKSLSNQTVLSINHISHPTGHSFIAASDTRCWKVKSEALYLDYVAFWCFSLRRPCKRGYVSTHTHTDSQKGPFCHLKAKEQDRPPTATAETVRLLWALTAYSGLECIGFSFFGFGGSVELGIVWPPKPWGKTVSCKSRSPWDFFYGALRYEWNSGQLQTGIKQTESKTCLKAPRLLFQASFETKASKRTRNSLCDVLRDNWIAYDG